ncbi:BON domain-containing protein [Kangiella sp. HZ709]|uniref:BON domain-containing protein n=1 Tax=Kangiella sp. HZ709 TaxID=2666328 RepID=UPI0012B0F3F0|nr:BON domain-containing protein [Kangiella sp. HZ709]MRX27441.1 BON domain-containing protein [Kangiella sp. HZ709]
MLSTQLLRNVFIYLLTIFVLAGCTTFGTIFEDNSIESRVYSLLKDLEAENQPAKIEVDSHNLYVLIYGQVPNESVKTQVSQIITGVPEIRKVFNELRVGSPDDVSGFGDTWISTKVRSSLTAEKGLDSKRITVRTENKEVFLMGLVTRAEGDKAALVARNISGVNKVVKIFEYID